MKPLYRTQIVVAHDHFPKRNLIAQTISRLVRINDLFFGRRWILPLCLDLARLALFLFTSGGFLLAGAGCTGAHGRRLTSQHVICGHSLSLSSFCWGKCVFFVSSPAGSFHGALHINRGWWCAVGGRQGYRGRNLLGLRQGWLFFAEICKSPTLSQDALKLFTLTCPNF